MRARTQVSILDHEVMPCAEDTGGKKSKEPDSLMSQLYQAKLSASNLFFFLHKKKMYFFSFYIPFSI